MIGVRVLVGMRVGVIVRVAVTEPVIEGVGVGPVAVGVGVGTVGVMVGVAVIVGVEVGKPGTTLTTPENEDSPPLLMISSW